MVPVSVLPKDLFQFNKTVIFRGDMVLTVQDTVSLFFFVCICKITLLLCLMCECCPAVRLVRLGYMRLDAMQRYILSFPKKTEETLYFFKRQAFKVAF